MLYDGPAIVITGFMCSGKSTIAAAVAKSLSCTFIDLDAFVLQQTGRTPGQIIDQDGEESFRLIEARALSIVLTIKAAPVIALGGGAWIRPENRQLIQRVHAKSFWLDAPFDLCWRRLSHNVNRPLARDIIAARTLYECRLPIYRLAEFRIDVSNKAVDRIADEIIQSSR